MSWDAERVASLKRLWAEGVYASEIAKQLGDVTRNGVIGKANRLGLEKRKKTPTGKPESKRPMSARVIERQQRTVITPAPKKRRLKDAKAEVIHIHDSAIPAEQRRTLMTIKPAECHFPIGEPGHADFFYCGAAVPDDGGRPYCPSHRQRMYEPARRRRSQQLALPSWRSGERSQRRVVR